MMRLGNTASSQKEICGVPALGGILEQKPVI